MPKPFDARKYIKDREAKARDARDRQTERRRLTIPESSWADLRLSPEGLARRLDELEDAVSRSGITVRQSGVPTLQAAPYDADTKQDRPGEDVQAAVSPAMLAAIFTDQEAALSFGQRLTTCNAVTSAAGDPSHTHDVSIGVYELTIMVSINGVNYGPYSAYDLWQGGTPFVLEMWFNKFGQFYQTRGVAGTHP